LGWLLKVGDKIRVNMHAGTLVDATIKAIIDSTDAVKYKSSKTINSLPSTKLKTSVRSVIGGAESKSL
jgi:hypothetical protein